MDKKTALKIARSFLILIEKRGYKFNKAFLFGSTTTGNAHKDSDIDIALVFKDLNDDFKMQIELMKLTREVDTRIEPHPFDMKYFNKDSILGSQILNHGIQIA